MGSLNDRVPKSPLKQWVREERGRVCTGLNGSDAGIKTQIHFNF